MMSKKTYNERLHDYFNSGGEPMNAFDVAELLDVTPALARDLISILEKGNASWSADVRRNGTERTLHGMTRKDHWRLVLKEKIRDALLTEANKSDNKIAKMFDCCQKQVWRIRNELIKEGHHNLKRSAKQKISVAERKRKRVRELLLGDQVRVKTNVKIAQLAGCSTNMVSDERSKLIKEGHKHLERVNVDYLAKNETDKGWVVPSIRHPEDEPYLHQAKRFREIWPMRWS